MLFIVCKKSIKKLKISDSFFAPKFSRNFLREWSNYSYREDKVKCSICVNIGMNFWILKITNLQWIYIVSKAILKQIVWFLKFANH